MASKDRNGGQTIPLNKDLKVALEALKDFAAAKRAERGFPVDLAANVVTSERGERLSPNSVAHWFKRGVWEPRIYFLFFSLGSSDCDHAVGEKYITCRWVTAGRSRISWALFVIDHSDIRAG